MLITESLSSPFGTERLSSSTTHTMAGTCRQQRLCCSCPIFSTTLWLGLRFDLFSRDGAHVPSLSLFYVYNHSGLLRPGPILSTSTVSAQTPTFVCALGKLLSVIHGGSSRPGSSLMRSRRPMGSGFGRWSGSTPGLVSCCFAWYAIRSPSLSHTLTPMQFLSIAFLLTDAAVSAARVTASSGINPYWRFALVFKCASDTIFLDDFKSVLDDIVHRKFSSANGTVHRGSNVGMSSSHDARKFSHSSRGDEFIECTSLGQPPSLPKVSTPEPSATKSRFTNPFAKRRNNVDVPEIRVEQEMSVTSERRHTSHDSWTSDSPMLPKPAHTVYGNESTVASDSDASLMIGRLV